MSRSLYIKKVSAQLLGLGLVLLAGCAQNSNSKLPSDQEIVKAKSEATVHPTQGYFLNQVQVRVKDEANLSAVLADMDTKNGVKLSKLDKISGQPIYLLTSSSTTPVDSIIKLLKSDTRVLSANRNRQIKVTDQSSTTTKPAITTFRTNDTLFQTQWALKNTGQEAPGALAGRAGADIGMDTADTEGSYEVVVGIIDTGVDYTHEDLAVTDNINGVLTPVEGSNIWRNPGEIPGDKLNNDNNGDVGTGAGFVDDVYGYNFAYRTGDPRDDNGHGTHVAGTIGALRDNFKGVSGIAKKVSIMALKFLTDEGSGSDFDAQAAIYYAIEMQQRFPQKRFILSNSWGSAGRSTENGDEDDMLLAAFYAAQQNGILVVAAAGNDGTSNRFAPHFPSNYSKVLTNFISVAATNNLDRLASFSSYGFDNVQVAAPGVLINSTVPEYIFGTPYAVFSGTSMATPHVTGEAAAVWGANLQLSAQDVKQRIESSVDVLPQLHGAISTSGRINVRRALANEVNMSVMPVALEVPYTLKSPRASNAIYDSMYSIEYKGAKDIQVCFASIDLVQDYDWMEIMGNDYLVRDVLSGVHRSTNYKGEKRELCSAPVLGDTLNIRLSKMSPQSGNQGGFETAYLKVTQ